MNIALVLWIGVPAGILLLVLGIVVTVSERRSVVDERLGRYLDGEEDAADGTGEPSTPLTDWLNIRVEKSNFGEKVAKDLAQADLKLKPGEYVAMIIIAVFFVGFVGYFYGGRTIVGALIGGVIGIFLPRFYVKRQQGKRLIRFSDQLPDMLNLMVNGLRAGYSTMQALEAVSKELGAPLSDEFHRVVREMQIGITMEESLANLLRRIPSASESTGSRVMAPTHLQQLPHHPNASLPQLKFLKLNRIALPVQTGVHVGLDLLEKLIGQLDAVDQEHRDRDLVLADVVEEDVLDVFLWSV